MSSRWTHPMCDDCWVRTYRDRQPIRLVGEYVSDERCCWCGEQTRSGIYVRLDPMWTPKHRVGDHEDRDE
jgi:hypothetical protein